MKYWDTIPHESLSTTTQAFHKMNTLWLNNQGISWGIALKKTNELIGHFGLHSWGATKDQTQLGYIIKQKYWGKGLGSEILSSVITFCFKEK
ncbi:MAG: GNAT family N-acetyltransferase [gamma proteobacterium symbiont of Taylorina sp.]|nr:GNAT family N-acetyltransferase [gamma proteobacterium symbiont of Taylorina sp.]